jgi:nitrogen fixation-related uncharacterized protein
MSRKTFITMVSLLDYIDSTEYDDLKDKHAEEIILKEKEDNHGVSNSENNA